MSKAVIIDNEAVTQYRLWKEDSKQPMQPLKEARRYICDEVLRDENSCIRYMRNSHADALAWLSDKLDENEDAILFVNGQALAFPAHQQSLVDRLSPLLLCTLT